MPVPGAAVEAAVAAARGYLRVGGTGEDALLATLARAAFGVGEAFTGAPFLLRAQEDLVAATGDWVPLLAEPVSAIAGVTGLPVGAAPFVLPPAAYAVDIDSGGRGWVRASPSAGTARVAVAYTAGLAATWDALPAAVAQGLVLLIAHLFEDRAGATLPPAAVAALWRPWRRMRLGAAYVGGAKP